MTQISDERTAGWHAGWVALVGTTPALIVTIAVREWAFAAASGLVWLANLSYVRSFSTPDHILSSTRLQIALSVAASIIVGMHALKWI